MQAPGEAVEQDVMQCGQLVAHQITLPLDLTKILGLQEILPAVLLAERELEAVCLELKREAAELALEALLLGLELAGRVVRLVVLQPQVNELLGDLVDDALALLLEGLPVDVHGGLRGLGHAAGLAD